MGTLRIATLNIWNKSGPWSDRVRLIRAEIERLQPAVLGLQEVLRYAPAGLESFAPLSSNCQATEIAEGLTYTVAYAVANDYAHGLKLGNALLSRYPLTDVRTYPLPGAESGETRSLLSALVQTPLGVLPVFVTHLNWKLHHGFVRMQQVRFIVERVFELAPVGSELLPPVLLGDFNAEPDSDEMRFLRGLKIDEGKSVYFADAWLYGGDGSPGTTFDRSNGFAARAREPSRRIDYIFVRGPDSLLRGEPRLTELAFHRAQSGDNGTVWPSDHFGLYTDVWLAPRDA